MINTQKELIYRKQYFDRLDNFKKNKWVVGAPHGSCVMNTFNMISPHAKILVADIEAMKSRAILQGKDPGEQTEECFLSAVREAILNKVDAISLSYTLIGYSKAYVNVLKEAIEKGIAIFSFAGNDSTKGTPFFTDKIKYNGSVSKRREMQVLQEMKGNGILFNGSVAYKDTGEEVLSSFSQHPTPDALNCYTLSPGEKVCIPIHRNSITAVDGTSFSTPITAGAFCLLTQYVRDKGLSYTRDDLLKILTNSGHRLTHTTARTFSKTYPVLNLENVIRQADKVLRKKTLIPPKLPAPAPKPPAPAPKPTRPVVKRPVRPAVKKPVVKRPVVKRPVRPAVKKPALRKRVPIKRVILKRVLKKKVTAKKPRKRPVRNRRRSK